MGFTKAFPVRTDKSVYPKWEDFELSLEQEMQAESSARKENIQLMRECLDDAKGLALEPSAVAGIAIALFEKRASHVVFHKESLAQELFKEKQKNLGD